MRIIGLILVTIVVAVVFILTGGLDSEPQSVGQQQQTTQPKDNGLGGL